MGLRDDRERFREVGEQRRQDLAEFIQYGDLTGSDSDSVRVPIKLVDLPEFQYDQLDMGGVGQGDAEPGDQVGKPQEGEGEDGEAGEDSADHEYYEMDPEEFAAELDERLGLDLEPKGKRVVAETEGAFNDTARRGPRGTLDFAHLYKQGLKRKVAMDFDENYLGEALRVEGWGPGEVFEWAREQNIPVSKAWLDERDRDLDERERWTSIEEMTSEVERADPHAPQARGRREGAAAPRGRALPPPRNRRGARAQRRRGEHPGRLRVDAQRQARTRRAHVHALDWYLTGKYDRAEFVYIAHDADAWVVERTDFFGIRSGGGTRISSAYELAEDVLEDYPFHEWNRYVFAAGDGENSGNDTTEKVVPLMRSIDANLHAYVETQPNDGVRTGTHAADLREAFDEEDGVAVTTVRDESDVLDAIETILSTENDD